MRNTIERLPDPPQERVDWVKTAERPCFHREHELPHHMVFRPGRYKHTCPGCGKVTIFYVEGPRWARWDPAFLHRQVRGEDDVMVKAYLA